MRILKRDLAGVGLLSRPYIFSDKSRVKQAGWDPLSNYNKESITHVLNDYRNKGTLFLV